MFAPLSKATQDEIFKNLDITKKKEESKNKIKKAKNKIKKDLQTNELSDIEDLDENFEFILKEDVSYELTVDFMKQVFPENILKKEHY